MPLLLSRQATSTLRKAKDYSDALKAAEKDPSKAPKFDAKLDALVPVIRGEMLCRIHCHRVDDIATACDQLSCSNMVDCSYDPAGTEWCFIPHARSGEWYLLLITNRHDELDTLVEGNAPYPVSAKNTELGKAKKSQIFVFGVFRRVFRLFAFVHNNYRLDVFVTKKGGFLRRPSLVDSWLVDWCPSFSAPTTQSQPLAKP